MQKETMSVHQALCDIKVADSKIANAITSMSVLAGIKASSDRVSGIPIKEFNEQAVSSYQKVIDLIRRTEALKAAVNESNSKTIIKVGDKEMSIAVAIYMMKGGINAKQELVRRLERDLIRTTENINMKNGDELDQRTDAHINAIFGNQKDVKTDSKEVTEAIENFRKSQSYILIDPVKVKEKIDELREEVDTFKANVDAAIQMSNATTMITIEY